MVRGLSAGSWCCFMIMFVPGVSSCECGSYQILWHWPFLCFALAALSAALLVSCVAAGARGCALASAGLFLGPCLLARGSGLSACLAVQLVLGLCLSLSFVPCSIFCTSDAKSCFGHFNLQPTLLSSSLSPSCRVCLCWRLVLMDLDP